MMEIDETVAKRRARMDKRVASMIGMIKNSTLANQFTAYKSGKRNPVIIGMW